MTHKELSSFSNEELHNFKQLELNIQQLQDLNDKLSRSELTIPDELAKNIKIPISHFGSFESINLQSLTDLISVLIIILNHYQPTDGSSSELRELLVALGEISLYFLAKNQTLKQ